MSMLYDTILPMTFVFTKSNVLANATTVMTLAGAAAADGFVVPTGYKFVPVFLYGESNADLTAGTLTFKVSANGTAIVNGPEPELSDTVQRASDSGRITECAGVAAGEDVGVVAVTSAAYAPNTADLDVTLFGYLIPTT